MSKLSKNYPMEDPKKWLIFSNSWQTDIDPTFAGRLAALAKHLGKKITVSSGYRSTAEQIKSFLRNGGKQDKDGNWIGGNGYAARPGRSWHEFGVAIDTSNLWLKALEKEESTKNQRTLTRFGLFKPMTRGNGCSVLEDWHIQPIETFGVPVTLRHIFYDAYQEDKLKSKGIDIIVNNKPVKCDVAPINVDGRILAPIRNIAEALGAKVTWDAESKRSVFELGSKTLTLYIGKDEYIINRVSKKMDTTATIIEGRTFVPVRYIAEAFDCKVDWNSKTKTVTIKN